MRIVVEQRHIDKGRRQQPDSCPVALALIDLGHERVFVGRATRLSLQDSNPHMCVR